MVFYLFQPNCKNDSTTNGINNLSNISSTTNRTTTSSAAVSSVNDECKSCSFRKSSKNELVLYMLVALLFILLFLFSMFFHVHINRLTDVSVFQKNIKSDFVASEVRKIVKSVLKEMNHYNQQSKLDGYDMFMDGER